jgi:hypothetical protein
MLTDGSGNPPPLAVSIGIGLSHVLSIQQPSAPPAMHEHDTAKRAVAVDRKSQRGSGGHCSIPPETRNGILSNSFLSSRENFLPSGGE